MKEYLKTKDYISFARALLAEYDNADALTQLSLLRLLRTDLRSTIGACLVLAVLETREGRPPTWVSEVLKDTGANLPTYLAFIEEYSCPHS